MTGRAGESDQPMRGVDQVLSDGDYARLAQKEGAKVGWSEHPTPPVFTSWAQWGRFCDAIRAASAHQLAASQACARCETCGGTREVLGHAEDCRDDHCALNGDMHSCAGKVEPCPDCLAYAEARYDVHGDEPAGAARDPNGDQKE